MTRGTGLLPLIDGNERRSASEDGTKGRERLEQDREMLLELLAQQQRVAQVGLITSGLTHDIANHRNHNLLRLQQHDIEREIVKVF